MGRSYGPGAGARDSGREPDEPYSDRSCSSCTRRIRSRGRPRIEFEAAFRDEWMPILAKGDDARLLWFCHHAHGSGPA